MKNEYLAKMGKPINVPSCENCETYGTSCCASSKARRETAISLAQLVDRQSKEIARLVADNVALRKERGEVMAL